MSAYFFACDIMLARCDTISTAIYPTMEQCWSHVMTFMDGTIDKYTYIDCSEFTKFVPKAEVK